MLARLRHWTALISGCVRAGILILTERQIDPRSRHVSGWLAFLARFLSFLNSGLGVLGFDKPNHDPDPPFWICSDLGQLTGAILARADHMGSLGLLRIHKLPTRHCFLWIQQNRISLSALETPQSSRSRGVFGDHLRSLSLRPARHGGTE